VPKPSPAGNRQDFASDWSDCGQWFDRQASQAVRTLGIMPGFDVNAIWKIAGIGLLGLIMLIPLNMVRGLAKERETHLHEAQHNIARRWAEPQVVAGPMLRVAGQHWLASERGGKEVVEERMVLPQDLQVTGQLLVETRYYGIYEVPVYIAELTMSGTFSVADWRQAANTDGDQAMLQVPISDIRGVRSNALLVWGNDKLELGSDEFAGSGLSALSASVSLPAEDSLLPFELTLRLAGTRSLQFLPVGKSTRIDLSAPWPDPGFVGNYLPDGRQIDELGFKASWNVLALNRRYAQVWPLTAGWDQTLMSSVFGVELFQPVTVYQRTERSIKYGSLFIALTFLGYFVFETLARVRLHPVQYLFLGLAMACFYLMLLALSEHIGFSPAFAIAALSLCALSGIYSAAILDSARRGATAAGLLAAIYALLYLLVVGEEYSLLVGSLVLFAMLSLAMLLTRHVDWYRVQTQPSFAQAPSQAPVAL
jgi:inner membrane protein